MDSADNDPKGPGFPIRRSADQRVLAPPHGFSQRATSFIASQCQGIHQMPFLRLIAQSQRPRMRQPALLKPAAHTSRPKTLGSKTFTQHFVTSKPQATANSAQRHPEQPAEIVASSATPQPGDPSRASQKSARKDPFVFRSRLRSPIHNDKQHAGHPDPSALQRFGPSCPANFLVPNGTFASSLAPCRPPTQSARLGIDLGTRGAAAFRSSIPSLFTEERLVELTGIEPATPCLQSRCSPS